MKIVLTDPQSEFRQALRKLLENAGHELVGECADGVEALRLVQEKAPQVLVLDINTPLLNGFEMARVIRKRELPTEVMVLAIFRDDTSVLEAFRNGIKAFVNKARVANELLLALRELDAGKTYLSPGVTDLVFKASQPAVQTHGSGLLTPTERQILQHMVEDSPVADIAKSLNLTLQLVEAHRRDSMSKLQVSGVGGLIRHLVREGSLKS